MKRRIPYSIRKLFEDKFPDLRDKFNLELNKDGTFAILDKDEESGFYFKYKGASGSGPDMKIELVVYPYSADLINAHTFTISFKNLENQLIAWKNRVQAFNAPSPIFEIDEILEHYLEEQAPLFEILDEDADSAPFSLPQQLAIHNVYESIINELVAVEEKDDELEEYIAQLKEDQKAVTSGTKNRVVTRFSRNLAKARKMGWSVFERVIASLSVKGLEAVWPKIAEVAGWIG